MTRPDPGVTLDDLHRLVPGLGGLSHAERIKLFGWYLHTQRQIAAFKVADVRACYDGLHLEQPANLARSVDALTEKKPPELLKNTAGYRLHAGVRAGFDKRFGKAESTVRIEAALAELPAKLTNDSERAFLDETLICYRHRAFRAAVVMAWNLAYDHLVHWILADAARLASFNQEIAKRHANNPKKSQLTMQARADFEQLTEGEVVEIVGALPGITANMKRSLKEKLGRRNTYAHPSTMQIGQPQVDDMIADLVHNVVLRLT